MKDYALVIMAAGMGSRFGGLKQIEPVGPNGEFILDYSIYDAIRAGFKKIVFIIKEENYEIFRDTIGKRIEAKIDVEYVFQKTDDIPDGYEVPEERIKPWGTGHAMYAPRGKTNKKFAVITSDDFYGHESFQIIKDFLDENDQEFLIVEYKIGNTLPKSNMANRGVCFAKNGYLDKIIESKVDATGTKIIATPIPNGDSYEITKDTGVGMAMYGFNDSIIKYLEEDVKIFFENNKDRLDVCEYLLPDVLQKMKDEEKVKIKVIPTPSVWKGITYKEDLDELKDYINSLIKKDIYPMDLWK
jgi:dTDP-glucose pyrophosphorylase